MGPRLRGDDRPRPSRAHRPSHNRRGASRLRWGPKRVAALFLFTMSNSAVFFIPAARCCARVGLLHSHPPRPRGRWSAGEGAICLVSRSSGATCASPFRDARLSALHRGDFRPGAALPSPALPPDTYSELLAARSSCLAGGVPDLPSPRLRAAAAGRHSPLRLSGPSPEDAPP